ncbi:MAG: NADPH-dependent FMN reductase [Pseudomonadota bacterium]
MTDPTLRILGISGSLRARSYNTAALNVAAELLPAGARMEFAEIGDLPLYNEDVKEKGFPPPAARLREQIRAADALLIVTPEYNYSVPGVLKNAIDWASRPPEQPFNEKPIAIMGASPGMLGSARAQYHLRQCFIYLNAHILNRPEVMISQAPSRFDENGALKDESTRELIRQLLAALVDWTRRLRR